MERYWCLRWLQQSGTTEVTGTLMRHAPSVRVDGLPLVVAVPSAPELPPGSRITLTLDSPDLLELTIPARFVAVLSSEGADTGEDLELLDEVSVEDALAEAEEVEATEAADAAEQASGINEAPLPATATQTPESPKSPRRVSDNGRPASTIVPCPWRPLPPNRMPLPAPGNAGFRSRWVATPVIGSTPLVGRGSFVPGAPGATGPRYGIQLPQPGDKSLMVSFRTLGEPLQKASSAPQNHAADRQANALKTPAELRKSPTPAAPSPSASPAQAIAQPALQPSSGAPAMIAGGRRVTLTPGMKDYRYSQYLEDWRRKVERIGAMNYPEEARGQFFGSLVLSVALRPDGSIDRIVIVRSSGNKILDDAAKRIVMMASPFAPFPPDIRKETDYLDITRTWKFTRGNALETR